MRKAWPVLVVAAAFLGLASESFAEVDAQVPLNAKVKGTLDVDEVETFRFTAPEGTALTVKIAAARSSTITAFTPVLVAPNDTPVVPDPEFIDDDGTKYAILSFVLTDTGEWRLELSAVGSGEYKLSLLGKPQKEWSGTTNLGVSDIDGADFSALPGSKVKVTSMPVEGSGAIPQLTDITGNVDFFQALSEVVRGTKHSASGGPVDDDLDFYVSIFNNEGPAGDVEYLVKVKPPKVKPLKLDLRASALGHAGGGETLLLRLIGSGGGEIGSTEEGGDLEGALLDIPAGALDADTWISLGSVEEPPIPSEDEQAAGPAVDLQPSGTTFNEPVTVILPFDFTKVPADATPDDIVVRIIEDNGDFTDVVPQSVDPVGGTVTVLTSGFSICIPIVPSGPPSLGYLRDGSVKPGGTEYWVLEFSGEMQSGGGTDSRARNVRVNYGEIAIHADGTFDVNIIVHGYQWQNANGAGSNIDAFLSEYTDSFGDTLNWAYDASGRNILLSGVGEDIFPTFRMSRDGRYMAGRHDGHPVSETRAEIQLCVRKNEEPLELDSLVGTWNANFIEIEADLTQGTGAAEPRPARGTGTFQFDGQGGCKVVLSQRAVEYDPSSGNFARPLYSLNVPDATYTVEEDGTLLVVLPPDGEEDGATTLRIFPGAGLDVMFGGHDTLIGDSALGLVLVRQGSGQSRSDLDAEFHGASFFWDPQSYNAPGPNVNVADFSTGDEGVFFAFDGGATADADFDRHETSRNSFDDDGLSDGLQVNNEVEEFALSVTVTSQGKVTLAASEGSVVGAVTRDAQCLVAITNTTHVTGDFGIIFTFRAPPDKTPPP
jgi:hypothetical protein